MPCKNCNCNKNNELKSSISGVVYKEVHIDSVTVLIKKLDNFYALPEYKTSGAAAMDLYSADDIKISPGTIALVSTGVAAAIPPGYEAQIRARSGNALKGIFVVNGPGTIDSDYRGEIKVILANLGFVSNNNLNNSDSISSDFIIKRGDRIAQMAICPVTQANLRIVDDLEETIRGVGGFGSTNVTK